jgi:tetratricopeptide (TPR) repeat protein
MLSGSFMPWAWLVMGGVCLAAEATLDEARQLVQTGRYDECVALARRGLKESQDTEEWRLLLTRSLLARGRYPEALAFMTNALAQETRSIRMRWLAREVFLRNGLPGEAAEMADEIGQLVTTRPNLYANAPDLIVYGQTALLAGADPKRVLDRVYETAKKMSPKLSEVYLARGGLALDKHDFGLAAKAFQEGLQHQPGDPDLQYGLARSYEPSDRPAMLASLAAGLERNSNHVESLVLLVDHCIDAEEYEEARKTLDKIAAVNPNHPEAWAYRALLALLAGEPKESEEARKKALHFWNENPAVDHLIGRKLSQKYRFAEGAARQRNALLMDEHYLPAMAQLAMDLLRLGEEKEGWRLAETVREKDEYDVAAFNLVTLRETMGKFATLTNDALTLRMGAHEATLYGQSALELLTQARATIGAKYGVDVRRPCVVEIFPEQKDFAVRTFGMPDNPGYLGVCFGNVVTATGPTAQGGRPVNWQAVLWHEFAHVVTLQLTRNKMPRWLSEGISVYEERQANPAWGQHMTPQYRELILDGKLTPVSQLSGAFLAAKSNLNLQFAYYESSLVVQFLVEKFGLAQLTAVLCDLRDGADINQAIESRTVAMARFEKDFEVYARELAVKMAPGLVWNKPLPEPTGASTEDPAWMIWTKTQPLNFWVMTRLAQVQLGEKRWTEAKSVLEKLVELYPGSTGADSAYRLLSQVHRALGDTNSEKQVLTRFASLDKEAPDAYLRLMELSAAEADWGAVKENASRYLAVNPLVAPPYRFLARAAEATGELPDAIKASRTLLLLDPPNPGEVHFKMAQLLRRAGDAGARQHVLQALEETPRNRAALRLLLDLNEEPNETPGKASSGAAEVKP